MKGESFSERTARERARVLLDQGTFRELLDPFARLESPHLPLQGIVPQSDDGVVVARGRIRGKEAVVASVEGGFQGGSIGEVGGSKIAGALEMALRDSARGRPIIAVLVLDTAGIRLQEANLGILVLSEIHAAIVELRRYVPVVGVIAGKIGCFGGMGIAAALCSLLIGSEIGRLGLNGPEVIEQEAGIAEFDATDRQLIWKTMGCRQRMQIGQIDLLVPDSETALAETIAEHCENARVEPSAAQRPRTQQIDLQQKKISDYPLLERIPERTNFSARTSANSHGLRWFQALTANSAGTPGTEPVLASDVQWGGETVRAIAVVPNRAARFPRARDGQVGIEEGWKIARSIREAIIADEGREKRALLAIVDVPGQAFGLNEEILGLHLSLASAVDAYATARRAGHPTVALIVGKAISGAFLAHGLQCSQILALDDESVEVHVMSETSVARVTRRSPEEIASLADLVRATARDIRSFASLGAVDQLVKCGGSDSLDARCVESVRAKILEAIGEIRMFAREPRMRLDSPTSQESRKMSRIVRKALEAEWD
jgi:malonate decarboxylase beta subunit